MIKLLCLLPLLCAGCLSYQSKIRLPDGSELRLPKDLSAGFIAITSTTSNGTYSVRMTNVVAKMNPAVMDAKTRHAVALIEAGAAASGTVAGNGAAAMAK